MAFLHVGGAWASLVVVAVWFCYMAAFFLVKMLGGCGGFAYLRGILHNTNCSLC